VDRRADAFAMALYTTQASDSGVATAAPLALVAGELERVERRILELVRSREEVLQKISTELILAGGKRVRPALALLIFRAAGGVDPMDTIEVGAALELIHSATLLHDDILDSGQTRRGRPSPLARHGLGFTLVAGDFLFSRAFGVAGRFDETVVGWATEACIQLCEGEMLQQRFRRNLDVTAADHHEIASRKTASLFGQAARIGAHFAGASEETVEAMHCLGHEIGIGFQIIDDLLDVLGPPEIIGKPVGSDLREGSPALPIVLGLRSLPEVAAAFVDPAPSQEAVTRALAALRDSSILDEVRSRAAEHIVEARRQLEYLPPSRYRSALAGLTGELLLRAQ
jgi:geranylgeranyl pyrophosphate synthase